MSYVKLDLDPQLLNKNIINMTQMMFMRTGRHHFIHAYDGQVGRFVLKFRNPNLFHCLSS